MLNAIRKNWNRFGRGFIIRVTSPLVVGFSAILLALGQLGIALPFIIGLGVLGGLKTMRQSMQKDK